MQENAASSIILTITGDLSSFGYVWGVYVNGFDPTQHCQKCLRGHKSRHVGLGMTSGADYAMDECQKSWDYLYVCAGSRFTYEDHIHIPMVPGKGTIELISRGVTFRATGAKLLNIPALPEGYQGLGAKFTTCRNYRFGMSAYGTNFIAD